MRTSLFMISTLTILFSCNNEDDSQNTVYKEKYEKRYIMFQDSLGVEVQDSGVVQVSKSKNFYKFEFVDTSHKIDPIENIEMEMTGNNSLRNVGWTPKKLIVMNKDSINIAFREGKRYWFVNGINSKN